MEPWLFEVIAPALAQIGSLSEQLAVLDKELKATSDSDPVARNLQTARGIGPITSLAFISVVDDPHRFESARQLSSYLGLVPGEHNSAESRRPPGAITKTGDPMLRGYLFEAAFSLMTRRAPETPLKSWSAALVKRSGGKKKKAAVGVARRLARIRWAMWRDNKPFDAARTAPLNANAPASKAA